MNVIKSLLTAGVLNRFKIIYANLNEGDDVRKYSIRLKLMIQPL